MTADHSWMGGDLTTIVEMAVIVLCALNIALMARLYTSGRTGTMPLLAAVGTCTVYAGIVANHAHFLYEDELHAGSVILAVGLAVSTVALLGTMKIGLFRRP